MTLSLVVALPGVTTSVIANLGSQTLPSRQDYISVALDFFNATDITCLFVILYRYERASDAAFGKVMRDNISTVIVARLINLIGTGMELVQSFALRL